EDGLDGLCLHRVVERRAAGVCVDVADLLDGSIRLTQGEAHRSSRLGSRRQGGRHMVGVVGGAVAQDLPVDGGVTPHGVVQRFQQDRKSTRLNSSHEWISYAVFCLKKKNDHKREVTG